MNLRKKIVSKHLCPNESIISITNLPRLGCQVQCLVPQHELFGSKLKSLFLPDEAMSPKAINDAIYGRRGSKVAINIPIFHDKKSPNLFPECEDALPDHIYMDSLVLVQVAVVFKQPFKPMALTAATPIWRGYLSDMDCSWLALVASNDERTVQKKNGFGRVDELLARHVSYLFIRDPLFVVEDALDQDDESSSDHFEVDENMITAYKRDALNSEKFWFRKNIFANYDGAEDKFEQMTINEIVNGDGKEFPGMIVIMFHYLESINIDIETRYHLGNYLEFICMRASGKIQTTATWVRNFVRSHPNYNHDSIVSQEINYDLIKMLDKIQKGEVKVPELLGEFKIQFN
ncbi:glutamate-cysteine ligase-domain-containing protein [Gigaspora rosea]|uniref:Glutamate--cysteine ligase n=1 Tax=Gigaspora rosea TaxID=44941 RepID=A0A397VQC8_9GLOM|nr:glutamate-cysteine ligase-domain-containing protein [Gigaspora rosea]